MSIFKGLLGKFKKKEREISDDVEYEGEYLGEDETEEEIEVTQGEEFYEEEAVEPIEVMDGGWEDEEGDGGQYKDYGNSEEDSINNTQEESLETYEIEQDEYDKVKINYGGSGLLTTERKNKEDIYREIRMRVTDEDLRVIDEFIKDSVYVYELYEKVENSGLSLEVLVALGFTSEDDLERYRAVQRRGLREGEVVESEVSDDYKQEVLRQRSQNVPYFPDEEETVDVVEEKTEELIFPVKDEIEGNGLGVLVEEPKQDLIYEEENREDCEPTEEGEKTDEEEGLEQKEEKELGNEEEDVSTALSKLMSMGARVDKKEVSGVKENKEETEGEDFSRLEQETMEAKKAVRQVYIVGEGYELPGIEGYGFQHVNTYTDLDKYTTSKDNLLVITPTIPKDLIQSLGGWLKGITEDNERYRIVTLKDYPVKHEKVEKEISLTLEGLNEYFEEFTEEIYGETTSGSFRDIMDMLGE